MLLSGSNKFGMQIYHKMKQGRSTEDGKEEQIKSSKSKQLQSRSDKAGMISTKVRLCCDINQGKRKL